ncbi:outer membrane beta-barrel protein [Tunicatimonas pelagia]|uniref:outer membrane beta-barrel protein n=1 Tax=Tunicatimonas pelagia TaxID=931531 RepID=UPI002665AEBB|nr:outer membrane beta-barrel protein [Tunicatimonas pelagia]WKN42159.1 outer membrane beta-barrel protein [Tunicatimonas pelagia]
MKNASLKLNLLLVLAFVCISIASHAQDETEPKTLFNNSVSLSKLGFYVNPTYQIGSIDEATAHIFGVRGGVVLNPNWTVGGGYHWTVNNIDPASEPINNLYLDMRMGGAFVEYTVWSNQLFHLTFPLMIGVGEVEMDRETSNDTNPFGEENFFFVEPSAQLEVNLMKNIRFHTGIAYRIVGNMDYRMLDQSDISGLTGVAGLKIGLFR